MTNYYSSHPLILKPSRNHHSLHNLQYGGFLKRGIPKIMGFDTRSWSNDLDDLGLHFRTPPYWDHTMGVFNIMNLRY